MTRRRARMGWRWLLLVAFIGVPLVEIYVIIQIGQVIGAWWTILLLIADSVFGSWLIKREGGRAFRALQSALQEHRMPTKELSDGVLILIGGTLMLTPGFVLDIVGAICILPFTRPAARRLLSGFVTRRLTTSYAGPGRQPPMNPPTNPSGAPRTQQRPGPDDVVQGEVVD